MSYYVAEEIVSEHLHQHAIRERNIPKINFCGICYPRLRNTNRYFQRFWNWITARHNAQLHTGYTVTLFNNYRTGRNHPNFGLNERTRAITLLISSIRYSEPLTPFQEVCYYLSRLLLDTNCFNRDVTRADLTAARDEYLQSQRELEEEDNTPPVNTPANNQPPLPAYDQPPNNNLGNMATQDQIRTIMENIFGARGTKLDVQIEKSTAKVHDFGRTDSDDPIEWLSNLNRAATINKWATEARKCVIAGTFMKGIAAKWYDAAKVTMGDHWETGTGNNNTDNFTDMFKSQFASETRVNKWYHELNSLKQKKSETVDEYTAKFAKLVNRVNLTDVNQKKRMYLMGLNPTYTALVYTQNPGTYDDAVSAAKLVEVGFNVAADQCQDYLSQKRLPVPPVQSQRQL